MALSIDDRLAIDDLITAYADAVDSDPIAMLALVTDDVVVEGSISGTSVGTDGVRAWASLAATLHGTSRHLIDRVRMTPAGDDVLVTANFLHLITEPAIEGLPMPRIRATGRFEFLVRNSDGAWKIARRTALLDGFG